MLPVPFVHSVGWPPPDKDTPFSKDDITEAPAFRPMFPDASCGRAKWRLDLLAIWLDWVGLGVGVPSAKFSCSLVLGFFRAFVVAFCASLGRRAFALPPAPSGISFFLSLSCVFLYVSLF